MKYSSQLLFALARGLFTPSLVPTDGEVELPALILPVLELVQPISDVGGFGTTIIQRASFIRSPNIGLAASQPQNTTTQVTFGRGLWEVELHFSSLANFTQASDGTAVGARVDLVDPVGTISVLANHYSVNGVPQVSVSRWRFLFTRDSWLLQIVLGATGVAQTQECRAGILASLLV